MDGISIGERIRTAREARGWSQEQLAVYAGVASKTVFLIETGRSQPKSATLRRLGEPLKINFFEEAAS